ncbi:MAG: hypothetical protein CML66_05310 [Rhodobacteraceae bacterium]|nr:hypothetical protein [Paracoccaceae bacterium]MAY45127.1 hypothetical protein [Paracoccaceae bacterium]
MTRYLFLALLSGLAGQAAQAQTVAPGESAATFATVRGWDVFTITDGDKITACRALKGDGADELIFGYDRGWSLIVPSKLSGDTAAASLWVDAVKDDRQVSIAAGFATLELTEIERSAIMKGSEMDLQIGDGPRQTFLLEGTTAALLKAQDCFDGQTGSAAPGPDATTPITGENLGMAYFKDGRFRQRVDGSWVEEDANGIANVYDETERDADSVYLQNTGNGDKVSIDTKTMLISKQESDGTWTTLYQVTGLDQYISPRAG